MQVSKRVKCPKCGTDKVLVVGYIDKKDSKFMLYLCLNNECGHKFNTNLFSPFDNKIVDKA